jgi:glutathione synthase
MPFDIAVVMDAIASISIKKDSTFALLLEAARRGHRLHYVVPGSLSVADGEAMGRLARLQVRDDPADWFTLDPAEARRMDSVHAVLMRRDPPVDAGYLQDTWVLSLAAKAGVRVMNDPQGLRDMNEKLYALHFPQCCPPTLVTREAAQLREFVAEHRDCVVKPLDGMGGRSIFRARADDDNLKVIIETLTAAGELVMAQRYIPEITLGDKRILLIDGEPVPHALARIPQPGDFRGNLAAGGRGEARPLSERDRWIAGQVGPEVRRRGMLLVGLDVIGDYLTEVNVTSPTCIRELDAQCGLNIAGGVLDALEERMG